MNQDFIIEIDYFENRFQTFNILGKFADEVKELFLSKYYFFVENVDKDKILLMDSSQILGDYIEKLVRK